MPQIETERLLLRPLQVSDADALRAIVEHPDFADHLANTETDPQRLKDEIALHIESHWNQDGYGLFATILKENGQFVGRCGFLHQTLDGEDLCEVAYLIGRAHWGRGLATEAAGALVRNGFEVLEKELLVCLINRKNARSIRVAEKIGMRMLKEYPLMYKYGITTGEYCDL